MFNGVLTGAAEGTWGGVTSDAFDPGDAVGGTGGHRDVGLELFPECRRECQDPHAVELSMGCACDGVASSKWVMLARGRAGPALPMLSLMFGTVPAHSVVGVPVEEPFEDSNPGDARDILGGEVVKGGPDRRSGGRGPPHAV